MPLTFDASNAAARIGSESSKSSTRAGDAPKTRKTTCGHAPAASLTGRRGLCDRCRGIAVVAMRLGQAVKAAHAIGLELNVPRAEDLRRALAAAAARSQPRPTSPSTPPTPRSTAADAKPPLPPAPRSPRPDEGPGLDWTRVRW